ncbi:MAG: TolC family protein [Synergistaceae bacterium]|nr:TolC family protein [Candidatus Equadaptatus faecalis]
MKKTGKIVTGILLTAIFASSACAADCENLKQLIELADKNNPVIFAQQQKVRRAEAVVNESTAKMMPKLKGIYAAMWQENPMFDVNSLFSDHPLTIKIPKIEKSFKLPLMMEIPEANNAFTKNNVFVSAALLTQTIYAGGSLSSAKAAAKLAYKAIQAESVRVTQTVENAVRFGYYSYKRAEAKKVVAEEAVSLTNDHLSQAEKLFKEGVVSKADVLRAKVAVADAELNLIRAKNGMELAKTALERAVAADIPEVLLSGDACVNSCGNAEPADETTAFENRAELKMYDFYSRQAAKIARAHQGELLPHILGFGAVTANSNEGWPEENKNWHVGLAATWNMFDSGEAHARTEQARSQSKEFLYRLEDKKNEIRMEVRQAALNLKEAKARLDVSNRQLTQAEEDYRIAVLRYKESIGSNLDMLDARLALTDSKTNVVDAKYDIALAEANLQFAMGK